MITVMVVEPRPRLSSVKPEELTDAAYEGFRLIVDTADQRSNAPVHRVGETPLANRKLH